MARDAYQQAVTDDGGMHHDLVIMFMRVQALLVVPIIPHYSEHIWKNFLGETTSVQSALYPEPSAEVDQSVLDSVNYIRNLVTSIRSSEATFVKRKAKGKGAAGFDPSKPKAVRLFVSREFPEWQTGCIEAMRESYSQEKKEIDMAKVRSVLAEKGLGKEKRAMPFCVLFGVSTVLQLRRIEIHD